MQVLIPAAGILILWLLSKTNGRGSSSPSKKVLPDDPTKKPIVVVSPPSPTVAPDVQKEVNKAIAKKVAASVPDDGGSKPIVVNKAPLQVPGGQVPYENKVAPMSPVDMTPTPATKINPSSSVYDGLLNAPLPQEATWYLDDSQLPYPENKPPVLAKVSTDRQALNYAEQGFHQIVKWSQLPSAPVLDLAEAAKLYFMAAKQIVGAVAAGKNDVASHIALLKSANNASSTKAIMDFVKKLKK